MHIFHHSYVHNGAEK